jgi:16S rRNA (cytosine1402-N4)-methyltransferase
MRMNKDNPLSAYEVVNRYSPDELADIFVRYGEEHNAKKIAQEIAFNRKKKEIETTKELASIIEKVGHKSEAIHPATRVFQAIRIEVNGELEAAKKGIEDAATLLAPGGRIAVISFHSLEDRIAKQVFERFRRLNIGHAITKKPLTAGYQESIKNRRSRSAKLRVFEKYA